MAGRPLGSPPGSPLGERPGAGVAPPVAPPSWAPADGVCGDDAGDEGDGTREGVLSSSDPEADGPRPPTASLTVVPVPPLKLLPLTSSYVVMPAMVTPKTRAAARTGRFQLRTRAR
ncbi:hypothetical protein ACH41H_23880 [Streptomyces sp. NPDC020800]|uniref:hypothetical protein n=1 Tax=Streptomyces sp. NPDC020800 TaxID=3365092 RepID=UPI0037B33F5D